MIVSKSQKKLTFDVIGSSFQVVFNTLCFFIIYALGIKYIGTEGMGLWSLTLGMISLIKLADFGLNGALIKYIAINNKKKKMKSSANLIRSGICLILLFYSSLSLILFIQAEPFLNLIIPGELIPSIKPIFNFMLINVVLTGISVTFLSCLDGINRIDLRSLISMISAIVTIIISFILIPKYGIYGIVYSQIIQASILILLSLSVYFYHFGSIFFGFINFYSLKSLFKYGFKFQLGSITSLTSEALIRLLISTYGNISEIPYYEMARKLCDQVRVFFSTAASPIVPMIAEQNLNEEKHNNQINLYKNSNTLMIFFAMPAYSIIILSSFFFGYIFFQEVNYIFSTFICILSITSVISLLTVIPFNISLGTGILKWNTLSYLVYIFSMFIFAIPLSIYLSSLGSIIGISLATIFSSLVILIPFIYINKIPLKYIFSKNIRGLVIVCVLAISIFIATFVFLAINNSSLSFFNSILIMGASMPIFYFMWKSKFRFELIGFLNRP